MISKGELETIVNYALKDKETLEMALKVGAAFSEIKISIISDFFYALENALNLDSDEWIIKKDIQKNAHNTLAILFYITKKQWEGKYFIKFESNWGLREIIIGVSKNDKILPIKSGKLKSLLDEKFSRQGKANNWWEWWQLVDEYRNWDNEEAVITMKFEKDRFVSYFKEQILTVVRIATPIIDEAVRSVKSQ